MSIKGFKGFDLDKEYTCDEYQGILNKRFPDYQKLSKEEFNNEIVPEL